MSISHLSFFWSFCITIFIITSTSVLGLFIVRKLLKIQGLVKEEIKIGTTICTLIGALYGLILALMVINLWQDYKNMNAKTIEEATNIDILYRDANNLDPIQKKHLRTLIRNYLTIIINDSWPLMVKGIESNKALNTYNALDLYVLNLKIQKNEIGQEALKSDLMDGVSKLAFFRKERLFYASTPRVPKDMWFIIFIGAVLAVSSTYFIRFKSFHLQVVYTVMHSLMIGIVVYLILVLNYPFRGAIKIEPFAFKKTLSLINEKEKDL